MGGVIAALAAALAVPAAFTVSTDPTARVAPAASHAVPVAAFARPSAAPAKGANAAQSLQVGSVRLTACEANPTGWCGKVAEPLDRGDPAGATINVGFEWYPATGTAQGTAVAVDGGPGWGSTSSRAGYLGLLGPLRARRNLLVFDLRGTGRSQPITCSGLQNFHRSTDTDAFRQAVAGCGDQLNHTWKRSDGGWAHASDLFGTANAARDLADVLQRLQQPPVDLYGDSYGTWFAQTYASRYPQTLRSVTLDASYEVLGLDPWYPSTMATAKTAFGLVCSRSAACAANAPRDPWSAITQLAARLRTAPISGTTTDLSGHSVTETVTTATLVDLVANAGFDRAVYKSLGAAADAVLDQDDSVPLLRLAAQSVGYDNTMPAPPSYSDGLYFAVACTDYPQLFDMSATPARRAQQLQQAEAGEPADAFAPFTAAEWAGVNAYTDSFTGCLGWPAPAHSDPPITATPPLVPANLPVLVLGGDLDSLTPAGGGQRVAQQAGPSARFVGVPNLTHITAMADPAWPGPEACGQSLYRQFTADPGALATLDTSCTASTPPIPTLPAYPEQLSDIVPATAQPGDQADPAALRAAAAGVATVDDAVGRYGYLDGDKDSGLRGGSWSASGNTKVTVAFSAARWVPDASTSGTAVWDRSDGSVTAKLTVRPDQGPDVTVDASWNTFAATPTVTLTGSVSGAPLRATMSTP
ncbi:alpha/beta hydrolase [Streptacidiphilus neutrinimicus]|uniref:alpha/beta hydrolase n=1 Tax=Streptacidiphilus neutrinimicus TaxID=105420 RepID=UPI0005A6F287|nr:alpha/beta fold hydrolase [Streptacidiphilus neutrinimicus]